MGLEHVSGMYDCNGRYALGRCYVYFILARDKLPASPMYLKIGLSENPIVRVRAVQVGCPVVVSKAGMVKCLSRKQAMLVEKDLHLEFADHSSSGEWFRFDWEAIGVRENMMERIERTLSARLREWKWENIDLASALAVQRILAAKRQSRSRARRARREALGIAS